MAVGLLSSFVWLAAAVVAPACTEVPSLGAREYRNIDYQFTVVIPPGLHGCMVSAPCPNHGLWIPLRPVSACAGSHDGHRYIGVDANFNTALEAANADRLAAVECRERGARNVVPLTREEISGRKAAGCRRDFPDGHREVTLIVLRKTEAWRARWIEISASLVTTPAHYGADLRKFQQVLRGIRVHRDGPIR